MKVKVIEDITVSYKDGMHKKGDVFELAKGHYAEISKFVEVVEEDQAEEQEATSEETTKAPEDMNITELKEELDKRGVEYLKSAKKDELIALLSK